MGRFALSTLLIPAYAVLLLAAVLSAPLRIPEILQIGGTIHFSLPSFMNWVAKAPDLAPLNYFAQLPLLLAFGTSRIAVRLVSVLFALASCVAFLKLLRYCPVRGRFLPLAIFMLLPMHLVFATQGRPFEQALFFLVLATWQFCRLLDQPSIRESVFYALALTLCVYSEPYSYLPAIGYLLFLFRFVNQAKERRGAWYALGATVLAGLLYVPYYFWARPQLSSDWFSTLTISLANQSANTTPTGAAAAQQWLPYLLPLLLIAGIVAGAWSTFGPGLRTLPKDVVLFCLFGGVVSTLAIVAAIHVFGGATFSSGQILATGPAVAILFVAGFEWSTPKQLLHRVALAALVIVFALCIFYDGDYLATRTGDLRIEADSIAPELTRNSCVVFVSERLSKMMFLVFDPKLDEHECLNFFHQRLVLASQPNVRPDQQHDAEGYFRGLNFEEVKRMRFGAGQIVVMEQAQ